MKKIILTTFLICVTNLVFAANVKEITNSNNIEAKTTTQKNKEIIEYKVVIKNGVETCHVRECKMISVETGGGNLTEVKVCGEWKEVECPKPIEPSGPLAPSTSAA